jgi:saccharopine dehydrogenase (NAD+, L-lysine forming)
MNKRVWLRAETKPFERRTPLTPDQARNLITMGHTVTVERSEDRIFPNNKYEDVGCVMVAARSWETTAPVDAIILGLKELPDTTTPIKGIHIYFAHCFKGQDDSKAVLGQFAKGGGTLYDLEFLKDDHGKRVAAFGYWAGYAGAAVNLLIWLEKQKGNLPPFTIRTKFDNQKELVDYIRKGLQKHSKDDRPDATVFGARGRCGCGVTDLFKKLELETFPFNREETKGKGWFTDILKCTMMFNCVYLDPKTKIMPFLTLLMLRYNQKLSVVGDISCDPNNPDNPIRVYDQCSTFEDPSCRVECEGSIPVDVQAIDHLPALLPRESSEEFSGLLFKHLVEFLANPKAPIWEQARRKFTYMRDRYYPPPVSSTLKRGLFGAAPAAAISGEVALSTPPFLG